MLSLVTLLVTAIINGEPTLPCDYPSTAALGNCSGVLVHPRIVLTAAHCIHSDSAGKHIAFGNSWSSPVATATAAYCRPYPGFDRLGHGVDWAYCWLNEPMLSIPTTPVATAYDLQSISGSRINFEVDLVGFGRDEVGTAGVKKLARMRASKVKNGELFLQNDWGESPCHGDSGGPVYLQFPDGGWRVVALDSYGESCYAWEATTLLHQAIPWVEGETGVSLTVDELITSIKSENTSNSCLSLNKINKDSTSVITNNLGKQWYPPEDVEPSGCSVTPHTGRILLILILTALSLARFKRKR